MTKLEIQQGTVGYDITFERNTGGAGVEVVTKRFKGTLSACFRKALTTKRFKRFVRHKPLTQRDYDGKGPRDEGQV